MSANTLPAPDLGRRSSSGTSDLATGSHMFEGRSGVMPTAEDIAASIGPRDKSFEFPALTDDVRAKCAQIIG